jgi:hypothetical protein
LRIRLIGKSAVSKELVSDHVGPVVSDENLRMPDPIPMVIVASGDATELVIVISKRKL